MYHTCKWRRHTSDSVFKQPGQGLCPTLHKSPNRGPNFGPRFGLLCSRQTLRNKQTLYSLRECASWSIFSPFRKCNCYLSRIKWKGFFEYIQKYTTWRRHIFAQIRRSLRLPLYILNLPLRLRGLSLISSENHLLWGWVWEGRKYQHIFGFKIKKHVLTRALRSTLSKNSVYYRRRNSRQDCRNAKAI